MCPSPSYSCAWLRSRFCQRYTPHVSVQLCSGSNDVRGEGKREKKRWRPKVDWCADSDYKLICMQPYREYNLNMRPKANRKKWFHSIIFDTNWNWSLIWNDSFANESIVQTVRSYAIGFRLFRNVFRDREIMRKMEIVRQITKAVPAISFRRYYRSRRLRKRCVRGYVILDWWSLSRAENTMNWDVSYFWLILFSSDRLNYWQYFRTFSFQVIDVGIH